MYGYAYDCSLMLDRLRMNWAYPRFLVHQFVVKRIYWPQSCYNAKGVSRESIYVNICAEVDL